MITPALPLNESERLAALDRYKVLDTEAEQILDDLTQLASQICETPIALISLIDEKRQWFKSKVGIDASETAREISFCGHAIHQNDLFEIMNAVEDTRFFDNPLVLGDPKIRFYAGMPLTTSDGYNLGTLCVIDREPKQLSQKQRDAMVKLARQAVHHIENRISLKQISHLNATLENKAKFIQDITDSVPVMLSYWNQDLICEFANQAYAKWLDQPLQHIIGAHRQALLGETKFNCSLPHVLETLAGHEKSFEQEFSNPDGSQVVMALRYIPNKNQAGIVVGFYSIVIDITERKILESQRINDERQYRDTLIREVHHRIKNNLQGVTGILRNLSNQDAKLANTVNNVISQVQTIAVIHGLQGRKSSEQVELHELLGAITINIRSLWNRQITLKISPEHSGAYIDEIEAVPIALVLNELVTNAAKHHHGTSPITIQVYQDAELAGISIEISNASISAPANKRDPPAGMGLQFAHSLLPKHDASLTLTQLAYEFRTTLKLSKNIVKLATIQHTI